VHIYVYRRWTQRTGQPVCVLLPGDVDRRRYQKRIRALRHRRVCHYYEGYTYICIYIFNLYVDTYTHDISAHINQCIHVRHCRVCHYGVASISRLLKIICLFCKRALQNRRYSAKETYNFKGLRIIATPYYEKRFPYNMAAPHVCHTWVPHMCVTQAAPHVCHTTPVGHTDSHVTHGCSTCVSHDRCVSHGCTCSKRCVSHDMAPPHVCQTWVPNMCVTQAAPHVCHTTPPFV